MTARSFKGQADRDRFWDRKARIGAIYGPYVLRSQVKVKFGESILNVPAIPFS